MKQDIKLLYDVFMLNKNSMYTFLMRSLCKLHMIYLRTLSTHQYVTVLHFLHFDLLHVMMMLRTSLSLFLAQRRRLYLGDAPQS